MDRIAKTYKTPKIFSLVLGMILACGLLVFTPALARDKEAMDVCSTAGLSNKNFDDSQCETDAKCEASPDCIDATPVASVNRLSSPFGYRYHPIDGKWKNHNGVDFATAHGTPIYAPADGKITKKYDYNEAKGTGFGNYIELEVAGQPGVKIRLAHMSCFADGLKNGDNVKKGQIIGFVGSTGGSTGNHLHFEIRQNGKAIDPLEEDNGVNMCTVNEKIAEMNAQYPHEGEGTGGGSAGGAAGGSGGGYSDPTIIGGNREYIESPARNPHLDKDCFPAVFKESMKECMFCSLFQTVFTTASRIAKASFDALAQPVKIIVSVGFALWMAFKLLAFLSSVESKDAPTFLKMLINQSFLVIVAVILLNGDVATFMSVALEPIFNTGFKLAQMTMKSDFVCADTFGIEGGLKDGGLPSSMGISIVCTIQVIQEKLVDIMSIGSSSICVALHIKNFLVFPHLGYFFSGVAIWAAGLLLLVIFPFLMLDAVVQMAVAVALLPAAIGAFTFKKTRGYVIKVWESFLSTMFHFVFLTIVMMILITTIENTMKGSSAITPEAVEQSGWDIILAELSWTGVAFLQLIFVFLLGWAVLGEIAKFASRFASSVSSTNIGSQIGTLGASGATNAAKKVGAPIINSIGSHVKSGASAVYGEAKEGINQRIQARKADKLKSGSYAKSEGYSESTDEEGNTTYSYRQRSGLLRRFKDKTAVVDKDGRIIAEQESRKGTLSGKEKKVETLGNVKMTSKTNADGEEVLRDYDITDPEVAKVLSGPRLNPKAAASLRNNPALSKQQADEVLLMQVMKSRMPAEMEKFKIEGEVINQGEITYNDDGSMQIVKTTEDGTQHVLKMNVDPEGGQVTTVYETIGKADKNGQREVKTCFSNGVVNMVSSHKINAEGKTIGGSASKPRFAVNSAYTHNRSSLPIDYFGKLAGYMPDEATTFAGMSETDIASLKKQFKEHRSNEQLDEFSHPKTNKSFLGKWSKYFQNKGKAMLQMDEEYIGLSEEEVLEAKRRKGASDE